MNKIQEFMLKHPYVSLAAILPFAFTIVMGLFSIILNIVLPAIITFWVAGWIYTAIVGRPIRNYYRQPLWDTNYK